MSVLWFNTNKSRSKIINFKLIKLFHLQSTDGRNTCSNTRDAISTRDQFHHLKFNNKTKLLINGENVLSEIKV